jgi:hypothetical protein
VFAAPVEELLFIDAVVVLEAYGIVWLLEDAVVVEFIADAQTLSAMAPICVLVVFCVWASAMFVLPVAKIANIPKTAITIIALKAILFIL